MLLCRLELPRATERQSAPTAPCCSYGGRSSVGWGRWSGCDLRLTLSGRRLGPLLPVPLHHGQLGDVGALALQLGEVSVAGEPGRVPPQLDGVLVGRHFGDDGAEDGGTGTAIEHDRRHPELANALDHGPRLGDDLVPCGRVREGFVAESRVEVGLLERRAYGPDGRGASDGGWGLFEGPLADGCIGRADRLRAV